MEKAVSVVDASNILYRLLYTINDSKQVQYLFTRFVFQECKKGRTVYVCFDTKKDKDYWRNKMLPGYKGERKAHPLFAETVSRLLKDLEGTGIICLIDQNYEADDLIGAVCLAYPRTTQKYIYSTDKDLYSLLDEYTIIVQDMKGNKTFTVDDFRKKYTIEPDQFVYYKAMVGDASDNIKGVYMIGPKTAKKIIRSLGGVSEYEAYIENNYGQVQLETFCRNVELMSLNTEWEPMHNYL